MVLVGRSRERLDAACSWIGGRTGTTPLAVVADLSLLSQARRAAGEIVALSPVLDVLVNNAGLLSPGRVETAEGHELTLAVNHLAPFVLTRALLPALQASGRGRVVMTGSSSSDLAGIDPDDLQLRRGWRMTRAYARSKLALLMTTIETARTTAGVSLNVVHPGLVATGLVRSGGIDQAAWRLLARVALSEAQGADAPLHAALAPELEGVSGRYLKRHALVAPNRLARDPALRARVLAATERLAGPD